MAVVVVAEVVVKRHLLRRLPALLQSVRPRRVLAAVAEAAEAARCRARMSCPTRPLCMARPLMGLIPLWSFSRTMAQTCRRKTQMDELLSISHEAAVAVVAAHQPQKHSRKQ